LQAAKNGVGISEATIYTTASPCWNCFKLIANVGLRRIVYVEQYGEPRITSTSKAAGIELVDFSKQKK
jgi:dCMP deaminase